MPLFAHEPFHRVDPGRMIVETGTGAKLLATAVHKRLARFVADLVERLQAIGGEAGHCHEDASLAGPGQLLQDLLGVRLEPALAAEERLERLRPLLARPAEALDEGEGRALDVRGVRIAALGIRD